MVVDLPLNIWPSNMMEIIKSITSSESPCPEPPLLQFKISSEAAEKKFLILRRFNFDPKEAIETQAKSLMGYGSEFRKWEILFPLLKNHSLWPRMKEILINGSRWPTEQIPKEDRIADLLEALEFGNHKGATTQPKLLLKLVSGDVKYGYVPPLPLGKILKIPNVCMAPLNIQLQWMINNLGEIIEKDSLAHDQSFEWTKSCTSVNPQTDKDLLQQCKFGKCLLRLIIWAVATRRKYPNWRILAKKDDFKSAYCQMHLNWETAARTVTQLPENDLMLMSLRLTFGGSPGPFEWGIILETVCNLTTAIRQNDDWEPIKAFGRNQHLVPPPKILRRPNPIHGRA
jgi:hypothetical protein